MEKAAKNISFTDINTKSICNKFSSMPINDCVLKHNQIDIWQFPLGKIWGNALTILNIEEQERAARFYFDIHRERFIAAHAFLRTILSRYLQNKNPCTIEFTENKYGKPQLANNSQNLEFNLSHSENIGLLAIGKNAPLGIDIEFFSKREYLDLARYMFSPKEVEAITQVKPNIQPLVFFNIWAQKEAFIKACGMGLSYPTKEFDVAHISVTEDNVFDKKHNTTWNITSFKPTITSCGAICYTSNVSSIRYIILEDYCDFTQRP